MTKYLFSPSLNHFYPTILIEDYRKSGNLPLDAVELLDEIAEEFIGIPPNGKKRGVIDGMPSWVDIPTPPNSELLSRELSKLGSEYKKDIYDLNTAYLAAIVSDGPSEVTKQQIVREQITQRKARHSADIASAKEKYPV